MNNIPDKKDDILKKLLSQDMLEQPSDNFTAGVFDKLGITPSASAIKYEPVISKNAWIFIAIICAIILLLAFAGTPSIELSAKAQLLNNAISQTNGFFASLINNTSVLIVSISTLAVFVLFGADSLYRQSKMKMA